MRIKALFGCQLILGTSGKFKIALTNTNARHRKFPQFLNLGVKTKPETATVYADFLAAIDGIQADVGEFNYVSQDGYLTLVNTTPATGLVVDPANEFNIPISYVQRPDIAMVSIHQWPQTIE